MKKAALLLATGYEEGESLFVVDILRRAGLTCNTVSTEDSEMVEGGHGITVKADLISLQQIHDYDMVILPGGAGAARLKSNPAVLEIIRTFNGENKWIAAICAAPMVLHEAGITKGRKITSYPGEKYRTLFQDSDYTDEIVVIDGNIITSRGPATTLPFAYALVDALGGDSKPLKEGMLYNMLAEA